MIKLDLPPIELQVATKLGRIRYIHALQEADYGDLTGVEHMMKEAIEEAVQELGKF